MSSDSLPCQPTGIKFPSTIFSGKPRSFNSTWFDLYPWLEYSVCRDAAFCYACRVFGSVSICTSRPEQAFTTIGFRDWKHATGTKGILATHNQCLSHKQAMVAWEQRKAASQRGSVADQLGSIRSEQIKQNRHYIKTVAEVLLLCSKQDIAMRGHQGSSESSNRGNFKEILFLVAKHDPIVEQRLLHGPRNAIYTSATIQNEILKIMGNLVRSSICRSIQKGGYYSILVDETKDLNEEVKYKSINLRDRPHLGSFREEGYLKACTAHNMAVNFKFKMVF